MGFLSRILAPERRTSLENPSFDLNNPPDWAFDMLGARKSSAGVNVNPETALTLDTVWRGVNLIAGDVGKLPLYVYRREGRGKEKDRAHPAYYLLRRKPNEAMTAFQWRRLSIAHALLHGNGYSYIRRGPDYRPVELLPLSPVQTWPVRVNGVIWYVTKVLGNDEMRKIPRHDMLHVKGFGPDGLQGYNWVAKARETLGLSMAGLQYSSVFYRNNAKPSVVITFPQAMDKRSRDELRDGWERMQSGLENAHRTAVLDRGGDIKEMTINARDAQMIETMKLGRVQVANLLGLPPHKLGDDGKTAYNSLEQENQQYLDEGLDPWLVNVEEESWDKLLTEDEKTGDTHEVLFDRKRLVRADVAARTTYYVQGLTNGWLSIDDVREEEDYNPLPGGLGGQFRAPLNTAALGGAAGGEEGEGGGLVAGEPAGVLLDTADLRQRFTWDCGPTALQIACGLFGVGPESPDEWVKLVGATEKDGTDPAAMMRAAVGLGLAVTAGEMTVEDLGRFFAQGRPVVVAMQALDYPATGTRAGHYAVVNGVGLGQVMLQDPVRGRVMLPQEDFTKAWHDVGADGTQYKQLGIALGEEPLPPEQSDVDTELEDDDPPDDPPADPPDDGQRTRLLEAHRLLLESALARMARRLGSQARKAARNPAGFGRWLDGLEAQHRAAAEAALGPPLAAIAELTGRPAAPAALAGELLGRARKALLETSGAATAATLAALVERDAGELERALPGLLARQALEVPPC